MEQRNSIRKPPYRGLTGNSTISSHDLNRDVLSRALDAIAEYGPERLFLKCAKAVSSKLGIKPDTVHLDTTSFHYEGRTRTEEGCNLVFDPGYSRDLHPELNQINELMIYAMSLADCLYLQPVLVATPVTRPVSETSSLTTGNL